MHQHLSRRFIVNSRSKNFYTSDATLVSEGLSERPSFLPNYSTWQGTLVRLYHTTRCINIRRFGECTASFKEKPRQRLNARFLPVDESACIRRFILNAHVELTALMRKQLFGASFAQSGKHSLTFALLTPRNGELTGTGHATIRGGCSQGRWFSNDDGGDGCVNHGNQIPNATSVKVVAADS